MNESEGILVECIDFKMDSSIRRLQLFDVGIDGRAGVYAAFSISGECFYVGRAKHLLARIWSHWSHDLDGIRRWWLCGASDVAKYGGKVFAPDKWMLKTWVSDEYQKLELIQIINLKPKHNTDRFDYRKLLYGKSLS